MPRRVTIVNETNATLPEVAFSAIARSILGTRYELTVIVTTPEKMQHFNTIYRNITKPTDILSFPIAGDEGEIYICPEEAKKEMKKFGRDYTNFIAFLFIHACVHLKGYDHGSTMERIESEVRKKFGV